MRIPLFKHPKRMFVSEFAEANEYFLDDEEEDEDEEN